MSVALFTLAMYSATRVSTLALPFSTPGFVPDAFRSSLIFPGSLALATEYMSVFQAFAKPACRPAQSAHSTPLIRCSLRGVGSLSFPTPYFSRV